MTERDDPLRPIRVGSLGPARLQVDVDAETFERVRAEYERAVAHGYVEDFFTFAMNHCATESEVTVDGEPVDADSPGGVTR